MNKIDYLILGELERDAALSFVDIAKKVGATPCTVKRRYEKMKKAGIIGTFFSREFISLCRTLC